MKLENVRGMRDIWGEEAENQRELEIRAGEYLSSLGYESVRLPSIEFYELIAAKAGPELLDSLYEFKDKGGRSVALTPELTASAARFFATKLRDRPKPVRIWYVGQCFRYDEPQRGRYRQFTQLGAELYGSASPLADAELAFAAAGILKRVGIAPSLKVGNVGFVKRFLTENGAKESALGQILRAADHGDYQPAMEAVQGDAKAFLKDLEGNPQDLEGWLRREQSPSRKKALKELAQIVELLKAMMPEAKVIPDLLFVRGLAYYTGFIFEAFSSGLDSALLGGGRYDNLLKELGGPATPAVGFAAGVDRIALLMKHPTQPVTGTIFPLDEHSLTKAARAFSALDGMGFELYPSITGAREAMSRALKASHRFVVLAGELDGEDAVTIRDLKKREQQRVQLTDLKQILQEADRDAPREGPNERARHGHPL